MYSFVVAALLFLLLAILSMIITYYVVVLLNQKQTTPEPSINATIATNILLLVNYLSDLSSDTVDIVIEKTLLFTNNWYTQVILLLRVGAIIGITYLVHTQTDMFLETSDSVWRCSVQPFFQNALLASFQVVRVIFDAIVPLYNYAIIILGQATQGTFAIAVKCDIVVLFDSIRLGIRIFLSLFESVFNFVETDTFEYVKGQKNIRMNDFNVTNAAIVFQDLVVNQENTLKCICQELTPVFDIAFVFFKQIYAPRCVNHIVNIFVSMLQESLKLVPPYQFGNGQFPNFNKPIYHINGAIYEAGKYADTVVIQVVQKLIRLFDIDSVKLPERFLFSIFSHFVMGTVHLFHTALRSLLHVVIPLPEFIYDSDYMMEAFSIRQAMSEFHAGVRLLSEFLLDISSIMSKFLGLIDLDKAMQFSIGQPLLASEVAIYILPYMVQSSMIFLNLIYITYEMSVEILLKSFIYQEDRVWVILQKYDGLAYPENVITCEIREQATWDLTNKECKCNIEEYPINYPGPYKAFGELRYDPYCGQPNLQANVFSIIQNIADNLSVGEIIEFPLAVTKSAIKFVLNIDAIASNTFFDYPQNCGYGASNEALEKRWEDIHGSIIPCAYPYNKTHIALDSNDPVLVSLEKYNTMTSASVYGQFDKNQVKDDLYGNDTLCFPRHEMIRYYDCMQQRHQKSTCTSDQSGCTCPLETIEKSSCQCIHKFPDMDQEIAETGTSNLIVQQLHQNQNLCNSFVLEPIFRATNRLTDYLGMFFESFTRTCETLDFETSNAIEGNKCQLYISSDFFCSTSMSLRSLGRFVTNELRDISMALFDMMSDDLDITLDFSTRFCDLERTVASISGMIASIFQSKTDIIAKAIFPLAIIPIRALEFLDKIFSFLIKAIKKQLDDDSFYQLLKDEIDIVLDWVIDLLDGLKGITVNYVSRDASQVFDTIIDAIGIIKGALSKVAFEFAGFAIKIYFDITNIITNKKGFDTLFSDIEKLFKYVAQIVEQAIKKFSQSFLSLLGKPISSFITKLFNTFSSGVQSVEKAASSGIQTVENAVSSGVKSIGKVFSDIGGIFGRRRLRSSHYSLCDSLILHYSDKEWKDIPFLDKNMIHECIKQEEMVDQINAYFGISLPHDMISNWKRKYIVAYEFAVALNIYLSVSTNQMVSEIKKHDIDPEWLVFIQKMQQKISLDFLIETTDHLIEMLPPDIRLGYPGYVIGMYQASTSIVKDTRVHRRKLYRQIPTFVYETSEKLNITFSWSFPKYYQEHHTYRKRLGVAALDSSILPCTGNYCINCAVLDDFVEVVIDGGTRMTNYYTDTYTRVILPDFVHWYDERGKEFGRWSKDVTGMMDKSLTHKEHVTQRLGSVPNKTLTNFDRATKDWDYLFANFELRNVDVFTTLKLFFEITDDTYVPYFAYSLPYYISYPLTEACPIEIIYCNYEDEYIKIAKTSQRIQSISNAIWYIFLFVCALYISDLFVSLPIVSIVGPYLWLIIPSIYLFVVYRYTYTCFPNIPNCLVDDMFAYINDVLFPECFCHYFPGISKSCSPETCFLCSQQTPFYSCRQQIELIDRMGYLWAPTMYLKYYFPESMDFLYRTIPFSWMLRKIDGVGEVILNDVNQIEVDCMNIHSLDIGVFFVVFLGATYILSIIVSITIRYVQYGIQILTMFFLAAANMSISIELSTISGIKDS